MNSNNDPYTQPVDGSGSWRHIPGQYLKHVSASGRYLELVLTTPSGGARSLALESGRESMAV